MRRRLLWMTVASLALLEVAIITGGAAWSAQATMTASAKQSARIVRVRFDGRVHLRHSTEVA
jgi:hypothetical protein